MQLSIFFHFLIFYCLGIYAITLLCIKFESMSLFEIQRKCNKWRTEVSFYAEYPTAWDKHCCLPEQLMKQTQSSIELYNLSTISRIRRNADFIQNFCFIDKTNLCSKVKALTKAPLLLNFNIPPDLYHCTLLVII